MSSRPAIPRHIEQEVPLKRGTIARFCCCPTALEKAHIIPWRDTQDHSVTNLIALCANCHTRFDKEKWPESDMRRYKAAALHRRARPSAPDAALIRAMVDII